MYQMYPDYMIKPNNPASIYVLKVNNRHTRTRCEKCSKLIIKTPKRRHWCRSGVFIVNFENISFFLNIFNFEHISTPTLRSDNGKAALTVKQLTI